MLFLKKASAHTSSPLYTPERNVLLLDFDGVVTSYDPKFVEVYIRKGMHGISREIVDGNPMGAESAEIRAENITKEALKHTARNFLKDKGQHLKNKVLRRQPAGDDTASAADGNHRHDDYYEQRWGISNEDMLQKMRDKMLDDPDYLLKDRKEIRESMLRSTQRNGLRIVIVSHSDRKTIVESLKRMGLSSLFDPQKDIIDIHDLQVDKGAIMHRKKSDGKEIYEHVLHLLGDIPAGKVMTIDDTSGNLKQAEAAGIMTISVLKTPLLKYAGKRHRSNADRNHADLLEFLNAYNHEIETGKAYSPKTAAVPLTR